MLGVETEYVRVTSPSTQPSPYTSFILSLHNVPPNCLHATTKLALLLAYIKMNKSGVHSTYVESLPDKFATVSTSWRGDDFTALMYSRMTRTKEERSSKQQQQRHARKVFSLNPPDLSHSLVLRSLTRL